MPNCPLATIMPNKNSIGWEVSPHRHMGVPLLGVVVSTTLTGGASSGCGGKPYPNRGISLCRDVTIYWTIVNPHHTDSGIMRVMGLSNCQIVKLSIFLRDVRRVNPAKMRILAARHATTLRNRIFWRRRANHIIAIVETD